MVSIISGFSPSNNELLQVYEMMRKIKAIGTMKD